jgi:hypothetical protein
MGIDTDGEPMLRSSVTFADAETRGRLSAWKEKLALDYASFGRGASALAQGEEPRELVTRNMGAGRERALAKILRAVGSGPVLERARLDSKHPYAVWSILKPRAAVGIEPGEVGEGERASLAQDCITVNYFVAGWLPDRIGVQEGLWTLEVPDHALGRAVQYSGLLHPGTIIREGHLNLLAAPSSLALRPEFTDPERGVLIKAGAGAFTCNLLIGPEMSLEDAFGAHCRVRSWIDDDRLRDDQIPFAHIGEPGDQLGYSWLAPAPFRRISKDAAAGEAIVSVYDDYRLRT